MKDDKDEAFNEIDFSFYTEGEIQIPTNNNKNGKLLKFSHVYNPKKIK